MSECVNQSQRRRRSCLEDSETSLQGGGVAKGISAVFAKFYFTKFSV